MRKRKRKKKMIARAEKTAMINYFLLQRNNGQVIEKQVEEENEGSQAGQIRREGLCRVVTFSKIAHSYVLL